ncbi:MAG: Phosphatidate cytidylyltransferase [bacterium ADurb.Bin236]|nr:MAG: Phosphatidate cytidylyltransferase [bacterium ADurb.Bin236]HOY61847.1 phosphatidate cytidylyltransferase [bacterium]HPN93220.1 phosphatidate cytidylyltransferase [bacterium]
MTSSNISVKIVGGLLLGPIVLYMAACGDLLLLLLASVAVTAGLVEFYGLLTRSGMRPMTGLGIGLGLLFLLAAYIKPEISVAMILSLAIIAAFCMQLVREMRGRDRYSISDLSVTIFGAVYIGALMSFVFNLKELHETYYLEHTKYALLVVLPLAGAWASDAGALFAGKAVGRTKLAPSVSPNKTIEGAVGGLAGSVMFTMLICSVLDISLIHAIFLGLIIGAFGQIGDLAESVFKRRVNVKDTGTMVIGAGGFMDRSDSILFSIPLTFFYLKLFVVG